jgi:hypothetical protein
MSRQSETEDRMNRSGKIRQSWALTRLTIAVLGVVLMLFATKWMKGLFRRTATLSDLRFPVLVLPPGNQEPFFASDAKGLTTVPDKSSTSPTDGTILIDSDFKQYSEADVHAKPAGEISAIWHALVPGPRSYDYTFTLKRVKTSGLTAALAQLAACVSYPGEESAIERKRGQLAGAKTVDEIIAILSADPIVPPPATDPSVPATEPAVTEKLPGC